MLDTVIDEDVRGRTHSVFGRPGSYRHRSQPVTGTLEGLSLLKAVLDYRPFPVFVMDKAMVIHVMNQRAQTSPVFYGIHIAQNTNARFDNQDDAIRLSKAVCTMTSAAIYEPCSALVPLSKGDGRAALTMSKISIPCSATNHSVAAWFVVTMRDNIGAVHIDPARLVETFEMTPAEANLCSALAQGLTLHDYAEREHIKITTARWHLQNVYERTGIKKQTELIGMIISVLA